MAKSRKQKNRKQVKRQTRHFQLRLEHPQDSHVREILDYAKSQRREVTIIREAVTLFWALENGNLEALFERFPQYRAQLTAGGGNGAGGSDLAKQIAEQIVLMNGTGGYLMQSAQPSPAPKAGNLSAVPVAIAVKAAPPDADTMADNFLGMLSMFD